MAWLGVHPDLKRHVAFAVTLCAAGGVVGVAALCLGLSRDGGVFGFRAWPFLTFGIVAIAVAYLGVVTVPRHYARASRLVASLPPTPQRIRLELERDADSTSLYATALGSGSETPAKRFAVLMPAWAVEPLLGQPLDASAYIDPATSRPVAFATATGLIWCMPSWMWSRQRSPR